jgi:hypothetical protein
MSEQDPTLQQQGEDAALVADAPPDVKDAAPQETPAAAGAEATPSSSDDAAATEVPAELPVPEGFVKVTFNRAVSFWVNGVEKSFPAGTTIVHETTLATIKQSHLCDAVE